MNNREMIRQRFLKVDSANVADVLDDLGMLHQGLSEKYFNFTTNDDSKMAGWAYTIQGVMAPYEGRGDPMKMEACAGIGEFDIPVWAGAGRGVCFFGELIAIGMCERGAVGSVVDGGIRDRKWIRDLNFPVYARYRSPIQSIGRWRVTDYGNPVFLEGVGGDSVVVSNGDFIFGDIDGVVVIPESRITEVLEVVEELTSTEEEVRREIRAGLSLSEALARYGHV